MTAPDPTGDLHAVVQALGGSSRAGQLEMATAVAQTLTDREHLLVQAGTGTGKSFGYLVPALAHAVERGERVVVSTATLALQRQIMTNDAPLVAEIVAERRSERPRVALLKGWQNYLCLHKVAGGYPVEDDALFAMTEGAAPDRFSEHATDHPVQGAARLGEQVVRLRSWSAETTTGDRDDLDPGVSDRAWQQVSVSKLECLGQACPMVEECFAVRAREEAAEADVVVTNHAMLGIAAAGNPGVLPEHDVLIIDEAHDLEQRVTSSSTLDLSGAVVRRAARMVSGAGESATALENAGQALAGRLELMPEGRLPEGLPAELRSAVTLLEEAARDAVSALKGAADGGEDQGARVQARAAALTLYEACERLLGDGVAQRREVLWCSRPVVQGREMPARLHLAPLDVAGSIATALLTDRAAVLTSATLALGGSFDPMARSLGLTLSDQPWRSLDVGSPFDHARQGILYVATHLPRAGRDGTAPELLDELAQLVRAAGGRTLGLFSSRRAAQAAAEHLRQAVPTPVFVQGEDQLPTLVRRFSEEESASLMGTLSLWQGVDVPGRTCSLVVMDRIPFPRPDDPIASARAEAADRAGSNGFMSVSARHAALLLAQGAGRLLRRVDDRGVVAILDPRIATARYGSFLMRSLPEFWRTTDQDITLGALRRLAEPPADESPRR